MLNWYDQRKQEGRCVTWKCNGIALQGRVRCKNCLRSASSKIQTANIEQTTLAYMAGVVDGEGSIGVYKYSYKSRKRSRKIKAYRLAVTVTNTNLPLLKLFENIFGGSINSRKKILSRKQCYDWHIGHQSGKEFLKQIFPYLFVKKRQAKYAIEAQSLNDSRRSFKETKVVRKKQEKLSKKTQELNHA